MSVVEGRPEAPAGEPLSRGDRNENPPGIGFLALLREDYRVHGSTFRELGLWAILVHRFGNWRMSFRVKLVRAPLTIAYSWLYLLVDILTGISLPYTVKVGRRVRIWHHSGIIIHARSIGDDTQIRQNTTMGIVDPKRLADIPTIGARVEIGCGACILGNVRVGDDAKIGANAVVLADVPAGATAVGIPARVVRWATAREGS
jgi:serine O-acetyltransferase